MFDLERWKEIFDAILNNKLRTFLTGLSVASGIFILVILLGFGQGMQNGIAKQFQNDASNRIFVWTQRTTKEYKGLNPGRRIQLTNENSEYINKLFKENIEYVSPIFWYNPSSITYGKETLGYNVNGVSSGYQFIENQYLSEGRFINESDIAHKTKILVISNKIKNEVFSKLESPIGELVKISGVPFKIVGVYGDPGEREEDRMYLPISTAQAVFNGGHNISNLSYTVKPQAQS